MEKKKLVMLLSHTSTGGLPQYAYKKIQLLKDKLDIYCIEYENITGGRFVVQRDRIINILDQGHFITIGEDKMELIEVINRINPDYLHLEEIPEYFLPKEISDKIYNKDRRYKIFETSHDSSFDPDNNKIYLPDAFFFVSQWQIDQYRNIPVPKYLAEYPIEYKDRPDRNLTLRKLGLDPSKKHVLNVGLFTPRKNQAEIFELSRYFNDNVQFHFVGNQADNFRDYWKPLLENKPDNCIVWGERSDTDVFYSCMDLFLFTSQGNEGNKETMPLVLRESLGWNMSILMYNLNVYNNYFDKFEKVKYLVRDIKENVEIINSILYPNKPDINDNTKYFQTSYNPLENKLHFTIVKDHPILKKFNYRVRDAINGLTFQPLGNNIDFTEGLNWWIIPNAAINDHNGLLFEVVDLEGNLIESHVHINDPSYKNTWEPLKYPRTGLVIGGKNIEFHHDPNDHSSFWSFYECVLRQDYGNIELGDIVVDIGANLGFFSLNAIKQGASKCYSFEPVPSTFEYLVKNVKDLPIFPVNLGIGMKDEKSYFISGEVTSISRSADHEGKEAYSFWGDNKQKIPVKLKPFNQAMNELGITFIDYLKVDCEGGEVELFNTIDPDFLKYRIRKIAGEIHLFITGVDGYEKIKNQIIQAGFEYEDDYNPGTELVIFYAKRVPKIKLVHILNNVNGDREKLSIESISSLSKYGIEYTQDITPLYLDKPPVENCLRPGQVSDHPGDYLLSPGHYGCYLGHRRAVCNSGENFDAILVSECDTILQVNIREFAEKVKETYFQNIKNNLVLTSYGKMLPEHPHKEISGDLYSSSKIVEAHLYLISKPHLSFIRNLYETKPWDVSDLWYDTFLSTYERGIYRKPYALQAKGESYLEKQYKDGHIIHDNSVIFNPQIQDDDITVIIQTCDKYEKFWRGWYLSWSRYWNWDLKWPVIFCNENKDLPFNDPRILQIKSGTSDDSKGFSTRMLDILHKVKTKYVLYIQDDMWLTNEVDFLTFKEALYKIRYNNWGCLRLHEKIWLNYDMQSTSHFVNGRRVLRVKPTSEWLMTHNASIWNKDFLACCIEPNEDPWTNEVEGTVRISNHLVDPRIYHLDYKWYYQPGASQNGEINPYMSQYQEYLEYSYNLKQKFDL